VVMSCLEQLRGELIRWPPDAPDDAEAATANFEVQLKITYVGEG